MTLNDISTLSTVKSVVSAAISSVSTGLIPFIVTRTLALMLSLEDFTHAAVIYAVPTSSPLNNVIDAVPLSVYALPSPEKEPSVVENVISVLSITTSPLLS